MLLDETVAEVLASAITVAGRRISLAISGSRGRRDTDYRIVRWFDTSEPLPYEPFPKLSNRYSDESQLAFLRSNDIQAILHELLAVRLSSAPDADVKRLSVLFQDTAGTSMAPEDAAKLFHYYDKQVRNLVERLRDADVNFLNQIRQEAYLTSIVSAIERHSAAVMESPGGSAPEVDFISRYRRHVADQHGQLRPPDFERRRKVPIRDLYVPQIITQPLESEARSPAPRTDIWEVDDTIDRTVLLGDPGGGKTTAAHVILSRHASEVDRPLPFLVILREFASHERPERSVVGHIEHMLETFYQCKPPQGLIERLLLRGSALIIFDGLDELIDTTRRAYVADIVERFCSEYPLAKILVTSRTIGYDEARLDDRQFMRYHIEGFDDDQVAEYVQKWFMCDEGSDFVDPKAFLEESASVTDLRRNPLMLALMCILYRGEGSMPRNRSEIYEKCTRLLFEKWDAMRKIQVDLRARSLVEQALRYLAYWLLTREAGQSAVPERELVFEVKNYFLKWGFEKDSEAEAAAREFVGFCRGRMWVLSEAGTTERGEALYTFTHRTFLEYYAAYYLASIYDSPEALARSLMPRIARAEWDMVAWLAIQIKDRTAEHGGERIFRVLIKEAGSEELQSRGNTLGFLGRCSESVEPSPASIRALTKACFEHAFPALEDKSRLTPLASLMLSARRELRDVVDDELYLLTGELIRSEEEETRLAGLRLAANKNMLPRAAGTTYQHWEWDPRFEEDILDGAAFAGDLAAWAMSYSNRSYELLKGWPDLSTLLFREHPAHILDIFWSAASVSLVRRFIRYDDLSIPPLEALGERLVEGPLGEFSADAAVLHIRKIVGSDIDESAAVRDEVTIRPSESSVAPFRARSPYTAGAYLLAISPEASKIEVSPDQLGPLYDFHPYLLCRWSRKSWQSLGPIPISSNWRGVFLRWAKGDLNFRRRSLKHGVD